MFDKWSNLAKSQFRLSSREIRIALGFFILFGTGAMAFVWSNVQMIRNSYDYQARAMERKKLLKINQQLKLEVESLRSLSRVQSIAMGRLRLQEPEAPQLITIFLK